MSAHDPMLDRLTSTQGAGATAPPADREAFLLEVDPAGTGWHQRVADYLRTFGAEEPVALVLVPPAGAPHDQLGRVVMSLVEAAGAATCAEIILLEHPAELLETLRAVGRVHWVPPAGAAVSGREGGLFARLAAAERTPPAPVAHRAAPPSPARAPARQPAPAAPPPGYVEIARLPQIVHHMAVTGEGTDACLAAGALPMPVHFYSPVPDIPDLVQRDVWAKRSELPGIDFRPEAQVAYLLELGRAHGRECDWPFAATPDPHQFHLENGSFSFGCAAGLHAVIRHHHPRRIIEVGSGQSSKVISAALQLELRDGHQAEYTVIDPYPSEMVSSLPRLTRLIPQRVELTALEPFLALRENDLLFIDSSHMVKIGGDVNFLFLEVLPRLAPGVIVHVHDIALPFEYTKTYFVNPKFRMFWTEAYLLQAFLSCNDRFEVLLSMAFLQTDHMPAFQQAFPAFDLAKSPSGSGSFWMRRKPAN